MNALLPDRRIVLGESNQLFSLLATRSLQQQGAQVFQAVNGLQVISLLEAQKPDLLLLDLDLPLINAADTTRYIRQVLALQIPIGCFVEDKEADTRTEVLEAGVNVILEKPLQEGQLENLRDMEEGPITETLYDLSILQGIARGNEAFVNKMLQLFIEQVPLAVSEMEEAFSSKDRQRLKAVAHRIKPTIDNMGIRLLKDVVRKIEQIAIRENSADELRGLLDVLVNTLRKVVESMKAS